MWADTARSEVAAGARTLDARFIAWAALLSAASLVALGVLTAIIPSPWFVRPIEPEPFAIVTWVASAVLMGIVGATYLAPAAPAGEPVPLSGAAPVAGATPSAGAQPERTGGTAGTVGSFAAFIAIGCPVCNKVALALLGTSGALSIFGPIQPFIALAAIALLVGTLAWRLRLRARAEACAV